MFSVRRRSHTREPAGGVYVSRRHHWRWPSTHEALGKEPITAGIRWPDNGRCKGWAQIQISTWKGRGYGKFWVILYQNSVIIVSKYSTKGISSNSYFIKLFHRFCGWARTVSLSKSTSFSVYNCLFVRLHREPAGRLSVTIWQIPEKKWTTVGAAQLRFITIEHLLSNNLTVVLRI